MSKTEECNARAIPGESLHSFVEPVTIFKMRQTARLHQEKIT